MQKSLHQVIQRVHFSHGESYERHAGNRFRRMYARVAADVAAAAPVDGTVLDAGCGTGRLAIELAKLRPDLRIRGIDLAPAMIAVAERQAQAADLADRVAFTVADLAALPLSDDSVDLVVSTASMHHWADVAGVVGELDRVLRADGRMWIYDVRFVPVGDVRTAAAAMGRQVRRSVVRTGRLPVALVQRIAVEHAP